jgi:hypothetical protein
MRLLVVVRATMGGVEDTEEGLKGAEGRRGGGVDGRGCGWMDRWLIGDPKKRVCTSFDFPSLACSKGV